MNTTLKEVATALTGVVELAPGTQASDFALANLNKALGDAQAEFQAAVKSEENKYGGYKYTPLHIIVAATRPSLIQHHLTVSQFAACDLERKTITVYTRLVHWDSAEWIQTSMEVPAELALGKGGEAKFNQQTIGGAQTYAQKYALKAVLLIPDAEEMIDSSEEKGDLPARAKVATVTRENVSQRTQLFAKAKEAGWGLAQLKKHIAAAYPESDGSTARLTDVQVSDIIQFISQSKPEDGDAAV